MERERMRALLERVRRGRLDVDEALDALRRDPVRRLGFAAVDLDRAVRRGAPEAVYAPGKTPEQVVSIARELHAAGQTVLATRVDADQVAAFRVAFPAAEHRAEARALVLPAPGRRRRAASARGPAVAVVSAGTSDGPVAEEAALTAELMGQRVERLFDVGAAGLHRLLEHGEALLDAGAIVVAAGMDGVLPTVVAGLVDVPVVGLPTSTGYGTGAGGEAALRTMLNACSPGVTVVNVDNGYGAGYAAATINRLRGERRKRAKTRP